MGKNPNVQIMWRPSFQTAVHSRWPVIRTILREAGLVAVAGLAFALAAHQISPRGLSLTRNYFPAAINPPGPAVQPSAVTATNPPPPAESLTAQIKAAGFQPASGRQVAAWFADPRRQIQQIVFVDARNDEEYPAGHIPGAWLFDPYHPEKYYPTVEPVCAAAQQIIVYCHGGDCDDSLTAATLLRDLGIAATNIFVYAGGMSEWLTNGEPVEVGPQNSGKMLKTGP